MGRVFSGSQDPRISVLDITPGANLEATYDGQSIRYRCEGLTAWNTWTHVKQGSIPTAGSMTAFHIEVATIARTSEVKFTVFADPILRWTDNGRTAKWVAWQGYFVDIGPSNILPGSGKHSVIIARNADGYTILENGKVVGARREPKKEATLTYSMQALDTGAVLDITLSEIVTLVGGNN